VEQLAEKSVTLEPKELCCSLVSCILPLESLEGETLSVLY